MSRFHPNIVVSDVFGSAGDVTAHHRDGKTYLRKRSRPVHPMSEAQAAHLEVHRRALAAWRDVPDEVKERWNEFAREVEPHRPPFDHSSWISGQNLFVSAYHGFFTLGDEHVPEAQHFVSFPPFAVSVVEAAEVGGDLVVRVEKAGLSYVEASRYWLYGKVQLMPAGSGIGNAAWKSVLAAGACSSSPVELILKDWRNVWPEVDVEASALQMHGKFVLLDAETGYRSQRRRLSCGLRITKREEL